MLQRQSEGLTAALGRITAWLARQPQTDQAGGPADRPGVGQVSRRRSDYPGHRPARCGRPRPRPEDRQRRGRGAKSAPPERRLFAAHQLRGNRSGPIVALVYPAHAGGSGVSHRQKRSGTTTGVSPQRRSGAGAPARVFPRPGPVAHRSSNGCAPRAWAPAPGNWSGNSPE